MGGKLGSGYGGNDPLMKGELPGLVDRWWMRDLVLPVAGGVLTALAFPRPSLWPLAWVCLVPLLLAVRDAGFRQVARRSWLFGLTGFMLDLAWVRRTMIDYGGMSGSLATGVLFLLAAYCALYPAVAVTAAHFVHRRSGLSYMVALPFFWTAAEFGRAHIITGFPWNSLGQSQADVLPLLQNADWGSFYGLSFLIVAVNSAVFGLMEVPRRRFEAAVAAGMVALALLYGVWRLRDDPSERSAPVTIGIVQGNIDQRLKWEPGMAERILSKYIRLSRSLLPSHPAAIVWPESALTFYERFAWRYDASGGKSMGELLRDFVREADAPLIAGTLDRIGDRVYNSVCLIPPRGLESYYYKVHLVPFGEYVPLQKFLFFVNRMVNGSIGDFTPGSSPAPLAYGDLRFGVTICYEQVFPELVRRRVRAGAGIICNVTNDAWFGRSAAPEQHFSASRFRAVEARRPVVRSANTGISGAVDSRGRVLAATPIFQPAAFTVTVRPGTEISPYVRFGDIFPVTCTVVSVLYLAGTVIRFRGYRKKGG